MPIEVWSEWPAPAKLNLFLHVVGRRADGYHLLQTVFQLIDLSDTVCLRVRADAQVQRHAGAPGVADDDDLAVRAARLLQARAGSQRGADIALVKAIPMGGGLGGGSSGASPVMGGLNRLWGRGVAGEAAKGADAPPRSGCPELSSLRAPLLSLGHCVRGSRGSDATDG